MKSDMTQQWIAIAVGMLMAILFGSWGFRFNVPTNSALGLAVVAFLTGTCGTRLVQSGWFKTSKLKFGGALILFSFLLPETFSRDFMLDLHVSNFFRAFITLFGLLCYIAGAFHFSTDQKDVQVEET